MSESKPRSEAPELEEIGRIDLGPSGKVLRVLAFEAHSGHLDLRIVSERPNGAPVFVQVAGAHASELGLLLERFIARRRRLLLDGVGR